jgi:hypothetical protein
MTDDKIILPIIHKWAKILWKKGLNYDELVSIGYCVSKPLKPDTMPYTIASWAKWAMIKHINDNKIKTSQNFPTSSLTCPPINTDIIDIIDAIENLTEEQATLIYMRFYRGMGLKEIAKEYNTVVSVIFNKLQRILYILKRNVLR